MAGDVNPNSRFLLTRNRNILKSFHRGIRPDQLVFSGKTRDNDEIRFLFRINPSSLKVSRKKLGQWVLTKFGYERQNWGNDLIMFDYAGSSGVFRPSDEYSNSGYIDWSIKDTTAWKKFREFEEFYEETGVDQNIMKMTYWGFDGEFRGMIEDFSYSHDVYKSPFTINYNFKYTGIPIRRPSILTKTQNTGEGIADAITNATTKETIPG